MYCGSGDSEASPISGYGIKHRCENEIWIHDTPEEVHGGLVVQLSFLDSCEYLQPLDVQSSSLNGNETLG